MRRLPPGLLALTGMAVGVVVLVPGARLTTGEAAHDHPPTAHFALDARTGATTTLETPVLVPGDRDVRCFVLDYVGPSAVVEVSADAQGPLADHLDLTVETVEMDDADDPETCGRAPATATILDGGTLESFADDTAAGGGLDAHWSPTGPDRRTYRITVTLRSDGPSQGTSASAEFRWEAHERAGD